MYYVAYVHVLVMDYHGNMIHTYVHVIWRGMGGTMYGPNYQSNRIH